MMWTSNKRVVGGTISCYRAGLIIVLHLQSSISTARWMSKWAGDIITPGPVTYDSRPPAVPDLMTLSHRNWSDLQDQHIVLRTQSSCRIRGRCDLVTWSPVGRPSIHTMRHITAAGTGVEEGLANEIKLKVSRLRSPTIFHCVPFRLRRKLIKIKHTYV